MRFFSSGIDGVDGHNCDHCDDDHNLGSHKVVIQAIYLCDLCNNHEFPFAHSIGKLKDRNRGFPTRMVYLYYI